MKTIETLDSSPFKHLIMTIGELPASYVESMTYYEMLAWLCNYVQKTVIPAVNNNAEAVAEIQQWIETLDLQDEVNQKLDEMVEDGTLAEIINQEIFGELNEQVTQNKNNISDLQTAISNLPTDEANITKLIKYNQYTTQPLKGGKLTLPTAFNAFQGNLYRDVDGNIYDDLDLSKYDTNNIMYVDYDNGDDSTGSHIEPDTHPFKTVKGALTYINNLASGNNFKIICKTYRFARDEFYNSDTATREYVTSRSVVIEPYDQAKTIVVSCDQRGLSWTRSGILWTTSRSNVGYVYRLSKQDGFGMFDKLTEVSTLEECQTTANTWYQSGSSLYLHTIGNEEPTFDKYMITLKLSVVHFNIQNNRYLRLKNIDFYPYYGIQFKNTGSSYENALICENVRIFGQNDDNGFTVSNVKTVIMKNCTTAENYADGFNYHFPNMASEISSTIVYENGCKASRNGLTYDRNICNASTIHEGANIIRVNGVYQTSKGPIIADINSCNTYMNHCLINQTLNKKAIEFEDETGAEGTGRAYLVDCQCLQTQSLSIEGTDDFNVQLKNFKGNYENDSLNITLYNE